MKRVGRGIEAEIGTDGFVFGGGVVEEGIEFGEVGALEEEAAVAHGLEEGGLEVCEGFVFIFGCGGLGRSRRFGNFVVGGGFSGGEDEGIAFGVHPSLVSRLGCGRSWGGNGGEGRRSSGCSSGGGKEGGSSQGQTTICQ